MKSALISLLALLLVTVSPAASQTMPQSGLDEPGRFEMNETDDGFLRLDTKTGTVSVCHRKATEWVCESVADERAALEGEIERLSEENAGLRERVAALERGTGEAARPREKDGAGSETLELELPSKQDMDKVMSFFEDAMRRLKDMVDNLKQEESKKDGQDKL